MNQSLESENQTSKNRLFRSLFFIAGTITLVLGAVGVVLPILPTTPFLLISLACYLKSSERMTHWMLNNNYFGTYIRNYKEGKGIPMKTKLFAISILWITIAFSGIVLVPIFVVQMILFIVATAVTVHLVRLPTCRC
ncbi:MAG: YbaN family protein [Candidatus Bathyarchaeota archaeon]|nr:YbaN family protein [Candidatus Bathyarchaeota archaeon]